jgi:2-dehydropantoate 2-reductase
MRFLVVGAGAVGGYFGGRLVQKGEDVTFLVRPNRRKQLQERGLVIDSVHGGFQSQVKTLISGETDGQFDVILLSVKAYFLESAIEDMRPYVTERTLVLPLLNGYAHYAVLKEAFGAEKVLGGLCFLETTLNAQGDIIQTSPRHDVVFGEWNGGLSERAQAVYERMKDAAFNLVLSDQVQKDIWQKHIFISSLSALTTLMHAPIGPILEAPHGKELAERLVEEIVTIAKLAGAPVPEDIAARTMKTIYSLTYGMKSSMQRDMEKGLAVETDHLHGALLRLAEQKGRAACEFPILTSAHTHLKIYESMRMT